MEVMNVLNVLKPLNICLKAASSRNASPDRTSDDIRLRMDGLFEQKENAVQFAREFTALYTNGPAGGGGIGTGYKEEILLEKHLVRREDVFWRTGAKRNTMNLSNKLVNTECNMRHALTLPPKLQADDETDKSSSELAFLGRSCSPAPSGEKIPLYNVAHSRAGDKGNDINFSLIPHFGPDIEKLKQVITHQWIKSVVSPLLDLSPSLDQDARNQRDKWINENVKVEIYEVKGIQALNIVVRNILDGGVNCSRRVDRHGKTISDLILCQQVVLPP